MKKKILVFFIAVVLIVGLVLGNSVFAITNNEYVYKPLDLSTDWEVVSINNYTFTISTEFYTPWRDKSIDVNEAFEMYTRQGIRLVRGVPHGNEQRYHFEEISDDVVRLSISVNRNHYATWCAENGEQCGYSNPTSETLSLYMLEYFSAYYKSVLDMSEILREYFYRIPPSKRPVNLYQVGMAYSTGSAYAGRLYWRLEDYIGISDFIDDYNLFLSYAIVDNVDVYALYFYDNDKNLVAWVDKARMGDVFKFEDGNRYVVSMLHFKDVDTGNYINWDNVKYMRIEFLTEPNPDSSVLIKLTNSLDVSIGEYWRTAEVFNAYYQAGYEEGFNIGFGRGQDLYSEEILEMLEKEFKRGYREGYNRGMSEDFDVFSYLESLFGEQGLGRLLRLELLPGVSLGAVILIPLAFWIVSFIMRWFR